MAALAPASASAQDNAGGCVQTGAAGTERTYRCRMGPIAVAPFQVLMKDLVFDVPKPAVNGHITDMSVDVVDTAGNAMPISRLMLHHIVFSNYGAGLGSKKDSTCSGIESWDTLSTLPAAAERFYAAGEERAKMTLPDGYGYPIRSDEHWLMTYMFMNHRSKTDTAFVQYEMTVDTRAGLTAVEPYWLDVENCKLDPVYDVPGDRPDGSTHVRKMVWTLPKAGRLVAGGGHVHGGGRELVLERPGCQDGTIYRSKPVWGARSHPFYNVKPVLHEPGPIHMGSFYSPSGVPLAAGEKVVLESRYDASRPHTRVMGIMVVYLAPDASVTARCAPVPNDFAELQKPAGRSKPPPFRVPIVGVRRGKPVNIDAPPGRRVSVGRRATVRVGDLFFRKPNLTLRAGGTITWRFVSETPHNITLANGPRGFSSPNLSSGRTFRKRLKAPGMYQLFCGIHPVDMTATVKVVRK